MTSRKKKGKKRAKLGAESESSDAQSDAQAGSDRTLDSVNYGFDPHEQDLEGTSEADTIVDTRAVLDEHLSDLTERKKQTRVNALKALLQAFQLEDTSDFLLSSHETVMASLTSCLRKGDASEIQHVLNTMSSFFVCLASLEIEYNEPKLTDTAFEGAVPLLERTLAHSRSTKARALAASTIALGALVSGADNETSLRLLDFLSSFWLTDSFTKKFQGNVKMKQKVIPPELSVATLDAWALLASVVPDHVVIDKLFGRVLPQLLRLLAHDSLDVRVAAGRVVALVYASVYGVSDDNEGEGGELPEATDDVVEVLSKLASDASKVQSRDKRRHQRTHFRNFLATVESGEEPIESLSLKGGRLTFSGWPQLVQLAAIRKCLSSGFNHHMHSNAFLIDIFSIESLRESDELYDDKFERRYRARERDDFRESQRQRKNAFQYEDHE